MRIIRKSSSENERISNVNNYFSSFAYCAKEEF